MIHTYLAFASIATLVVVSPGPATFLLLRNTPVQGRRAGLFNVAGIVAAVLSHATLSLIGVSALILASGVAFEALKLTAAAYLTYLGLTAFRQAWRGTDFSARLALRAEPHIVSARSAVAEGWLTNILNPKPSMFYISVFPQFLDPSRNLLLQGMTLAVLHATISATWFSIVVVGIDRIKTLLGRPAIWRGVTGLTGLVLVALAVRLLTLGADT
jgi:threonine/homoserine/homoserine lactone efflux protein